jgi:hypothetical protein
MGNNITFAVQYAENAISGFFNNLATRSMNLQSSPNQIVAGPYGSGTPLNLNIQGATQQNIVATSAEEAGKIFGSILRLMGAR